MNDLISRKAAIEAVEANRHISPDQAIRAIAALPSATNLLVALEWIANNGHLSHPSNIVNVAKEALAELEKVK